MSTGKRYKLDYAEDVANYWITTLEPACLSIEAVGSLRRKLGLDPVARTIETVGDIELLAVPRYEPTFDLFLTPGTPRSLFDPLFLSEVKNFKNAALVTDSEKLKRFIHPGGMTVEIFVVTPPAELGWIKVLRTGPADFTHWLVTPRRMGGALKGYQELKDGALRQSGKIIHTPDEKSFFAAIGMQWAEPADRHPGLNFTN